MEYKREISHLDTKLSDKKLQHNRLNQFADDQAEKTRAEQEALKGIIDKLK